MLKCRIAIDVPHDLLESIQARQRRTGESRNKIIVNAVDQYLREDARAQQLATALNAYTGDNAREDVIRQHDIDEAAIEAANPAGSSDIIVLTDGSRVVYDEGAQTWRVAGNELVGPTGRWS